MSDLEKLRYPLGKFEPKDSYSPQEFEVLVASIDNLPVHLEQVVKNLTAAQLDTPYREGGWTVRQLVHHLADSHMNAYIRFKWTLTEDKPVIKAYNEKLWAETNENKEDIRISLSLLKALHQKWVKLINGLSSSELQRSFIHPETKKEIKLERMVGLYAWHGEHHVAHITSLLKRMSGQ